MKGFAAWALNAARTIWRGVLVAAAMGAFMALAIGILELFRWQWAWLRWPLLGVGILLVLAFLGSVTRPEPRAQDADGSPEDLADAVAQPTAEELR